MHHLVETAFSLLLAILAILSSAITQWILRFLLGKPTKILPKLYYKDGAINRYLLDNCPALHSAFCPPWWMVNQHAQTIIPVFIPQADVTFKRELVKLDDGGILALDWVLNGTESLSQDAPVIFLLPGLAGDANGFKNLAIYAAEKGLRPVVFNKRGHGGCKVITPKLQSFGDPADFKQAVGFVQQKYLNAQLTGVGASAGSGLLVSYLGVEKEETPFITGVGISPGYDTFKLFHEYLRAPYNFLLLHGLRQIIQENKDVLSKAINLSFPLAATTVAQIEERLYCRIYGFKTIEEYWKENNPMRDILDVTVPFLSISSRDDPVCPEGIIPYSLFTNKENIILAAMDHGGHCGFIEEGTLVSWAEKTAIDYILSVLELQQKK